MDLLEILGAEIPIFSAPMAGAAGPDLVAAVCNAGAYGVAPLWGKSPDGVRAGIAEVRAQTSRNFAANLNLSFPYEDQLEACIQTGVHGVSLFWGMEPSAIARAKAGGLVVLVSVGCAEEARIAADAGADIIVAQGWEAGGHVWGRVSTMALVPAVADAVDVPVVAAGGIADGRGMAAALMLGASGVWIGTRLLASTEATIHDDYRARILDASESATEWYADLYDGGWPDAPHRALVNTTARAWRQAGGAAPGMRPGERTVIGHRPSGEPVQRYQSYTPVSGTSGDVEAMSLWSGQGVGLVREVMPAADIVAQIHREAMACVRDARGLGDADVGSAVAPAATGVNADTVRLATTGRREEATTTPGPFSSASFLKGYIDAFQAFDAARIASFYNTPCLSVRPDGSIHGFSDHDEIAAFFGRVVAAYRAEGMVSFQAGDVRCHPHGSASASLACTWAMKRGNGSVIRSWAQTYTVQRVAEDWRIVASVIHL